MKNVFLLLLEMVHDIVLFKGMLTGFLCAHTTNSIYLGELVFADFVCTSQTGVH